MLVSIKYVLRSIPLNRGKYYLTSLPLVIAESRIHVTSVCQRHYSFDVTSVGQRKPEVTRVFVRSPTELFVLASWRVGQDYVHSPNLLKRKCISEVVRIGSAIIFHLSKV